VIEGFSSLSRASLSSLSAAHLKLPGLRQSGHGSPGLSARLHGVLHGRQEALLEAVDLANVPEEGTHLEDRYRANLSGGPTPHPSPSLLQRRISLTSALEVKDGCCVIGSKYVSIKCAKLST